MVYRNSVVIGFMIIGLSLQSCDRDHQEFGYVDTADLLSRYDPAKKIRTELASVTDRWQEEADIKARELEVLRKRFITDSGLMSSEKARDLKEKIAEQEQQYIQFIQETNQKAAMLEAEKMQPIYNLLNTTLSAYGNLNGYKIIWGATPNGNIVYADSTVDLTDEILAYIDEHVPAEVAE